MSRSIKKGPFVQPVLLKRIQEMNAAGEKRDREDLEQSFRDLPGFRRTHHRGPRRPQACSGVCH